MILIFNDVYDISHVIPFGNVKRLEFREIPDEKISKTYKMMVYYVDSDVWSEFHISTLTVQGLIGYISAKADKV